MLILSSVLLVFNILLQFVWLLNIMSLLIYHHIPLVISLSQFLLTLLRTCHYCNLQTASPSCFAGRYGLQTLCSVCLIIKGLLNDLIRTNILHFIYYTSRLFQYAQEEQYHRSLSNKYEDELDDVIAWYLYVNTDITWSRVTHACWRLTCLFQNTLW